MSGLSLQENWKFKDVKENIEALVSEFEGLLSPFLYFEIKQRRFTLELRPLFLLWRSLLLQHPPKRQMAWSMVSWTKRAESQMCCCFLFMLC